MSSWPAYREQRARLRARSLRARIQSPVGIPDQIQRAFLLCEQNPYFRPIWPLYPKQWLFLSLHARQALYGGAAYGGKTFSILASALLYAHVPGYAAVLFRRTFPELSEPGGLVDLANQWLAGTDANFVASPTPCWTFPVGRVPLSASGGVATPHATLRFKHIQHDKDAEKLSLGATYQFMGWDELTTFTKKQYTMPQARLRRPGHGSLSLVPLRARAGTNPGGEGHEFVKEYFIDSPWYWNKRAEGGAGAWERRIFIPARISDNVSGDREGYVESLEAALDPVTLKRLMDGDWVIQEVGEVFDPTKLIVVQPEDVPGNLRWTRAWDTAGSEGESAKYTVGARMAWDHERGHLWVSDLDRFRLRPGARDERMRAIAEADGIGTAILIEKGAADSGIKQADDHLRLLAGFSVQCIAPKGDKIVRAWPLARQWNSGKVRIVTGPWVGPLKTEAQLFNAKSKFKDQIDALSLGFNNLALTSPSSSYTSGRKKRASLSRGRLARPSKRKVFG